MVAGDSAQQRGVHRDFLPPRRKDPRFQVLPGGAEDWNREQEISEGEIAGAIGRIECEVIRT
jgi:hypothetical protein